MTAYWYSPWYVFGNPQLRKRVWAVHLDGTGRIQTSLAKDFSSVLSLASDVQFGAIGELWGSGTSAWGSQTGGWLSDATSVGDARIKTPGVARAWSVGFGNSAASSFEVDSVTFELADRLRKVAV
jgi:hypothetical protein